MNKALMSIFTSLWLFSAPGFAQVRELPSPAGQGSGQPNLAVAPDGRVYLSWIERLGEGRFSLRFALKEGDGWSAPRVIAEGSNWFVNWADFPSMVALPDGSLAAHWLVKSGAGTFDYDVTISRSFDGGKTWGKPFVPHRDGVKAEHGFVSMFAAKDGSLAAVWLDGREMKADPNDAHGHGHGDMTLRYVKIKRDGALVDDAALDARVCECCQTSAAMTADGPVVVYRDRSEQEIRDISIVRLLDGKWSRPRSVFQDNWKINGCPVNGPSVAAAGHRVAVAWFTGANGKPQVKLAFSKDAGASFVEPLTVDGGNPAGRVDVLLLDDGSALVCWLEKLREGGTVRVRRVRPDGKLEEATTVAPSGTARSSGFPQMARAGDTLVFAWTGPRVLTAAMPLPSLTAQTTESSRLFGEIIALAKQLGNTTDREERKRLVEELNRKEQLFLAPAEEDREAFSSFLKQAGTGITRLIPKGRIPVLISARGYAGELFRGAGAGYSFASQKHTATRPELVLEREGFLEAAPAGANIGFLTKLGDIPLESVTVDTRGVAWLATFTPPLDEPGARKRQRRLTKVNGINGFKKDGFRYARELPVEIGKTYAMRSVVYGWSDVLVVFRTCRRGEDRSLTFVWKALKLYPAPQLKSKNGTPYW